MHPEGWRTTGGGGLPVGLAEVGLAPTAGPPTAPASGWWSRSPGPMAAHWAAPGGAGRPGRPPPAPVSAQSPPDANGIRGSA